MLRLKTIKAIKFFMIFLMSAFFLSETNLGTGFEAFANEPSNMPDYLAENWGSIMKDLTKTATLQEEQKTLPESTFFGRDKKDAQKEIDKLMDKSMNILLQGRALNIRQEAAKLQDALPALEVKADKLRNEYIAALTDKELDRIDAELEKVYEEIDAKKEALSALNQQVVDALNDLNLNLTQAQIDLLINSVTGDDLLQNVVVAANVKAIMTQLEVLSSNNRSDLSINQRYIGMYLVLNDLVIATQLEVIRKITQVYRPRLQAIRGEAENLRVEASGKAKKKIYTEAQRGTLETNAGMNAMTVKVADLYVRLLDRQKKSLQENVSSLQLNHDAADNTFRTMKNAGDLGGLIKNGLALFDSIMELPVVPEMQTFADDQVLRDEFEEISKRLKL